MLKIRCSALGQIMTDPRTKTETLSETTKACLHQIFIEQNYGRTKDYTSKAIEKGIHNEENGITMLSLYLKRFMTKNEGWLQNDHITGTPDIIEEDTVFDIKCSWDIFTFMNSKMIKDYEWQLRGYMALTGRKKATLAYCLTDTPRHLIEAEIARILFKSGSESYISREEVEAEVIKNMTYDDIPLVNKIRLFHIEHDEEKIDQLYERIEKCRGYYDTLSLSNVTEIIELS